MWLHLDVLEIVGDLNILAKQVVIYSTFVCDDIEIMEHIYIVFLTLCSFSIKLGPKGQKTSSSFFFFFHSNFCCPLHSSSSFNSTYLNNACICSNRLWFWVQSNSLNFYIKWTIRPKHSFGAQWKVLIPDTPLINNFYDSKHMLVNFMELW